MSFLFQCQNDQTMIEFYSDIVSSSIFNNQMSFSDKYPQDILTNYSQVILSQRFIKKIVKQLFKNNAQKISEIKQIVNTQLEQINDNNNELSQEVIIKLVNTISGVVFNRLEQIKKVHLLQSISLGSAYLKDVNWKITKTISSNSRSFTGGRFPCLFNLTLILNQSNEQSNEQSTTLNCNKSKEINLQMNKVQLKQFLTQLKLIKADLG